MAHELAVALMPEPSAGSKLLAEEFGIEYDEGAEGIDDAGHEKLHDVPDAQEITAQSFGVPETQPEPSFAAADVPPVQHPVLSVLVSGAEYPLL